MFHLFCVKLQNVYVYVHFDIQVSKSLDTQNPQKYIDSGLLTSTYSVHCKAFTLEL